MSRESGDRSGFLSTIRRAVDGAHRGEHLRPITPLPDGTVPPVLYEGAADFTDALEALGGHVRRVGDPSALESLLDEVLPPGPVRVALTDEPECAAVAYALGRREQVEAVPYTSAASVATADVGFSGALFGVARTGSIVVDAGRARGRTVSLLPPVHVALLREDAIVPEPGDLWRSLATAPMPSNLVQITGPSRSADIELVITLGVHGPRALWVGLLDFVEQENSA